VLRALVSSLYFPWPPSGVYRFSCRSTELAERAGSRLCLALGFGGLTDLLSKHGRARLQLRVLGAPWRPGEPLPPGWATGYNKQEGGPGRLASQLRSDRH
jgi:hypothetical protein